MLSFLHSIVDFAGRCSNQTFAEMPRICPVCPHHTVPWRLAAHSTSPENTSVDFAFQCSRDECRRMFVVNYRLGADMEFDLENPAVASHDSEHRWRP